MPPKSMDGNDLPFFSQYHYDLNNVSVDELLLQYKDNPTLLSHILIAKAEEDKKRTAEELRLAEEARLKIKYLEHELIYYGQLPQSSETNLNSFIPIIESSSPSANVSQVEYTPSPVPKAARIQKHRRTLSYESVLSLKNSKTSPSTVPKELSHEKVMEALRAKLKRSSSGFKKSSPELPNTYPTTGVLLLNLRNRQNKLSISRRRS